jgi:hypothetical protein
VNLFIEANATDSAFKNLRIVNDRFISDKTSNIAFVGGNLGVGVNSPQEALDIRGNMHFNRVSNVSSVSVDSNVVAEYTGPHDRPLRKYPEVALTSATTGGYTATASSHIGTDVAYTAFDGTTSTWHSQYPYYTANGGVYESGNQNIVSGSPNGALPSHELVSGYAGEYITLGLPKQIKMVKISINTRADGGVNLDQTQSAEVIVVAGSHDGSTWEYVDTHTVSVYPDDSTIPYTFNVNTSTYYKHVGLICTNTGPIDSIYNTAWSMSELAFYGYEEGDSSLDTTLKSVYNVPGTQQLEVYYDGQDYSDMPTVGSASVTDKAGGDQTGTPSSGVSFDSTYKAFVFDGTANGKIVGTHNLSGTSPTHTISIWFKRTVVVGSYDYVLAVGTSTTAQNSAIVINNDQIWFSMYGDDVRTSGSKIVNDVWYHLTVTSNGGIWNSTNCKMYLNGALTSTTSGGGGTINLTGTQFTLGTNSLGAEQFNGSIANFRLFSKALNAGQVQELYDYQKDYFLGSRSSVTLYKGHLGIGVAEPSGQLELAGDERIQEYPPGPMDGYSTYIPGHGVFCVRESSSLIVSATEDYLGWEAFDKNLGSIWYSNEAYHSGVYQGSSQLASETSPGSWLVLEMPYKIYPKMVQQYGRSNGSQLVGAAIYYAKANPGDPWTPIHTQTSSSSNNGTTPYIGIINSNVAYQYFAIVVTSSNPTGNDTPSISNLVFFGTPGPTTLDKGSLTLGRSLDVPRISRYDVDTETPRPEKLVLDFDTTVNSSPTDISGQGNHGTMVGATYSPVDKAFTFDGTDDYIRAETGFSGNQSHTASFWVKPDVVDASTRMMAFISSNGGTNLGRSIMYINTSVGTVFDFRSKHIISATLPVVGQWLHLAFTYDSSNGATKMYMDGILKTDITEVNASTTINLVNGSLSIGTNHNSTEDFDGQISNPKIYSVALEPSEVQKLYRLGRTGRSMVISDTAVGIGKVPEAQLDVRGSGGFTGDLTVGGNMNNYQYWFRGNRRNTNVTTGDSSGRIYVEYDTIDGYTSAWKSNQYYEAPVDGVYMTMGSFMAYPTHEAISYAWALVRRSDSSGTVINDGEINDMHDPRNAHATNIYYQSWQFKQSHKCNKGDRLQVVYAASNASAAMQLHAGWGNITIFKLG